MKKMLLFSLLFLLINCKEKSLEKTLEKTIWKACGDFAITDVLVFNHLNLTVVNDSIFSRQSNSIIGTVDRLSHHFGERRLYVKDLKGNFARYCEQ